MSLKVLKVSISVIAVVMIFIHAFFPEIKIDTITLVLLVLAIAPWLAPLIKSFELPNGFKIEFQDIQNAISEVKAFGFLEYSDIPDNSQYSFQTVLHDPNLELAGLRIEIEKRLRGLAKRSNLPESNILGLRPLLHKLHEKDILTYEETSSLWKLAALLDKAVHGAEVELLAGEWAMKQGPLLLAALDKRLNQNMS